MIFWRQTLVYRDCFVYNKVVWYVRLKESDCSIKEKVKKVICKTVKSHCLLGGLTSGKCSEIFPKSKFSALFFACHGQFALPETLLELLAASEQKPEKRAPQQRVVHIPLPRFGVAVEDV